MKFKAVIFQLQDCNFSSSILSYGAIKAFAIYIGPVSCEHPLLDQNIIDRAQVRQYIVALGYQRYVGGMQRVGQNSIIITHLALALRL